MNEPELRSKQQKTLPEKVYVIAQKESAFNSLAAFRSPDASVLHGQTVGEYVLNRLVRISVKREVSMEDAE